MIGLGTRLLQCKCIKSHVRSHDLLSRHHGNEQYLYAVCHGNTQFIPTIITDSPVGLIVANLYSTLNSIWRYISINHWIVPS